MGILEKAKLAASIHHIVIFIKSGIPIYNSKVPDTAGRKTRKRGKTQEIAKHQCIKGYDPEVLRVSYILNNIMRCSKYSIFIFMKFMHMVISSHQFAKVIPST